MKSRLVYRWGFAVLGFSAVVNLIVAVRVFVAMQSPVAYNIRVIEPPVYTNLVSVLPSVGPLPGESIDEAPQPPDVSPDTANLETNSFEVAVESYHYMQVGGRPLFRLNGRNYAAGDVTAFGTVDRVFPERIYFADGGFLSNSRRVFDLVDFSPQPVPVEHSPRVQPREESPHDPS